LVATRYSRVLLTGGAGFIGSHILDRLLAEGAEVTVLDNLSSGYLANISSHRGDSRVHLVVGDIRNVELLRRLVGGVDAVIHLAAIVSVPRSFEEPTLTNEVNATGTLNLLNACIEGGVKRFMYASSSAVYGSSRALPKVEDMKPMPASPYAVSKMIGESYCIAFNRIYGLETVCLRFFNVYGPRQGDGPYSGVIARFISRLIEGRQPVIYGDGRQTRDFTYVSDVVDASMLALEKPSVGGEVFNIGTGVPVSINGLAERLGEIVGVQVEPKYWPDRPGDIRHSYASIKKASRILGYSPKVALDEGLRRVVEWYLGRMSRCW